MSAETLQFKPGDRVRDKHHPELTGTIDRLEYQESGEISVIPYAVRWDRPSLAYDLRGMFAYWGTDEGLVAA